MQRTVSTTIKIVDEASAELQQIKNEVQQTGTASAEMQKKVDGISDTLNEAQSASESFKSQIRELREAMAQMLADGVQPTDEQFQALARRAGQLEDAMGDANRVIKDFASDTHNLDKYTSGVQGLTSAYRIFVSALTLVGIEHMKVHHRMHQPASAVAGAAGGYSIAEALAAGYLIVPHGNFRQQLLEVVFGHGFRESEWRSLRSLGNGTRVIGRSHIRFSSRRGGRRTPEEAACFRSGGNW